MKLLWAFIVTTMCLSIGIMWTLYTVRVQKYQLKWAYAYPRFIEAWLKSRAFLIITRIIGVLLILLSLVLYYVIFFVVKDYD